MVRSGELGVISASPITLDTILRRDESLLSSDLGEDVVMMDIDNGSYYALEGVASRIWSLLEAPAPVGQVCGTLLDEYEVDSERCENEVLAFVEDLVKRGILQTVEEQEARKEEEVASW